MRKTGLYCVTPPQVPVLFLHLMRKTARQANPHRFAWQALQQVPAFLPQVSKNRLHLLRKSGLYRVSPPQVSPFFLNLLH